ncbi:hypothetical protein C7S20_01000 [Christiangramia fulva]|uniref:YdhG-like domain-containing protein n=1 Tax=Christiangramia fulva TaxID=2126553 RepID=A0A2R3Z126_9FLAO|nr:YdeI/OmpD-associated family protein [Christiangramia fulva]AVR43954.1 hypothetical protein C7S20_01000 [Christiangramia fulva]
MAVSKVEEYIDKHPKWKKQLWQLHEMILTTELEPAIKWGGPVYTLNGKNVLGIGAFKNHFGIWFFNGALLKENTSLLVNAQEGKTKALRQIRFEEGDELKVSILLPYIQEAIQNQSEGKEVKPVRSKKIEIPALLSEAMKKDPEVKSGFEAMSPGCKREYAEYISEAKREETKLRRLEKIIPMIKSKKGLNDKYKY